MQVELPTMAFGRYQIKRYIHSWLIHMIRSLQCEGGWPICSGLNFISSQTGKSAVNHASGLYSILRALVAGHRIGRSLRRAS